MIRQSRADGYLLINQDDHAALAGRLAAALGNEKFSPPIPLEPVMTGITMHDAGWPMHDLTPTLNRKADPLHVLETPMQVATQVWAESARLAAAVHPYAGLLVSLHVLTLSGLAVKADAPPTERATSRHDMFLLNRFQQGEIERQEELRAAVGLLTDLRLKLGLAEPGTNPEEDLLRFNLAILRAMDAISLDACCGQPVFEKTDGVHPRPGSEPIELRLGHPVDGGVTVSPWPFGPDRLELPINGKRVPTGPYASEAAFQDVFAAAPVEQFVVRVMPG